MEMITGSEIPEGYECLGTVCGDGFDRAVLDEDNGIIQAYLGVAQVGALDSLRLQAEKLGADKVINCQFSVDKSMMTPAGNDYWRTSYPAYGVYVFGTAIRKK
ncbi:hypothetical protein J7382_19560 [Shimia sp. R11_0]|uniref:hypothetical protein n=1 Tax=Shimia sp. R11_0 TaxID=2821096 RepID=UPI001ADA2079|nr:hypothetical protein [Shimia sp. R11_0]MBO9479746.1 hypothetical protein [Shimia sp. R11_0]